MLAALSIRDIVLIDKLDLEFATGLSVLTGETGAGKSILLDAFALAIGARGDASLVRQRRVPRPGDGDLRAWPPITRSSPSLPPMASRRARP